MIWFLVKDPGISMYWSNILFYYFGTPLYMLNNLQSIFSSQNKHNNFINNWLKGN